MAFALTSQANDVTLFTAVSVAADAVTLGSVADGDFIYVAVTVDSGSVPTITVSDPVNGTYQSKAVVDHTGDQLAQQFYFKNSGHVAGTLVITASFSVNRPFVAMYAAAWSGADTATGFDVEAGQVQVNPATTTDAIDTTNNTTTAADLIIGSLLSLGGTTPSIAAGTGFTEDSNISVTAGTKWEIEHKTQGGAGSDHATATVTAGGNFTTFSLMMAVKPFVAGGAVVQPPFFGGEMGGMGSGGRFFKDRLQ